MALTWDIEYPAAMGVVKKALTAADGYEKVDVPALTAALGGCEAALTHSPKVVQALGGYLERDATPQLKGVFGHTNSAIQGTATAINAYSHGQVEMAQTAQRNATLANYPDDLPGRAGPSGATR
jgi:hypothetical protein